LLPLAGLISLAYFFFIAFLIFIPTHAVHAFTQQGPVKKTYVARIDCNGLSPLLFGILGMNVVIMADIEKPL
jgi:hypothetical protein